VRELKNQQKIKSLLQILSLWASSFSGAIFAFFTQVLLARKLGPSEFGSFTSSLATATLAGALICFGVPQLLLRVFGSKGWGAVSSIPPALKLILINTSFAFILLILWIVQGPHNEAASSLMIILFAHAIGLAAIELASVKHQLEENYTAVSLWQSIPHLTRLIAVATYSTLLSDIITTKQVAIIYALISICIAIIGAFQVTRMTNGKLSLKGHGKMNALLGNNESSQIGQIAAQAWPLGIFGLLNFVYFQSDIIIVKYLVGTEAAGHYSVAFSIMAAAYLVPTVLYQKFLLPKLHRWANHDKSKFQAVYRKGNIAMLLLGTVAMLVIWISANVFIPLIFGKEYQNSASLVNILAVCAPVQFLISSISASLLNHANTKIKVYCLAIASIANISLNFLLIPILGAPGAAISTVLSSVLLLSAYHFSAKKYVFIKESA
jgi:O-antigen/teichoic acid export membrane protein